MSNIKRLMIVDDSEIDRNILKNILCADFEIIEIENGYTALEQILSQKQRIDALLLDISMPVLDGFTVLELMKSNGIENLPVILITAEATTENVLRGAKYGVSHFISKPFEPDIILGRLRTMLDITDEPKVIVPEYTLTETDIYETNMYISKLKLIYKGYLKNHDKTDEIPERVSGITEILLNRRCSDPDTSEKLSVDQISLISAAAYFYDIGIMALPDEVIEQSTQKNEFSPTYETHTSIGAEIIWLNHSPTCRYFVKICADMCMHHHERNDGNGFPHQLKGEDISVYTQICALAVAFDRIFSKRNDFTEYQFDFVINELSIDTGRFSNDLMELFVDCKKQIVSYYKKFFGRV